MKNLNTKLIFTLSLLYSLVGAASSSMACSCSQYPMDDTDAVIAAAKPASHLGRSYHVDPERDIQDLKVIPTLAERINLYGFKGSSCEVHGPNDESLYYCSPTRTVIYKITIRQNDNCEVTVKAKSGYSFVNAKVLRSTCKDFRRP